MKRVFFYDQYRQVINEDGTILHPSSGITILKGEDLDNQQALTLVEELYSQSKLLGQYTDRLIRLEKGYAELVITLPDNKIFTRVIYTE